MKKTKKFTAVVEADLSQGINDLAKKQGLTLRQITERMIKNTLKAHRIAEEIRG